MTRTELAVVQPQALVSITQTAPGITQVADTHGPVLRRMRIAGLIALALGALALLAKPSVFTAPGQGLAGDPVLAAVAMPAANAAAAGTGSTAARAAKVVPAAGTTDALTAKSEQNLIGYLARKWRVADAAVTQIVQTALRASQEHKVDPLLVLAVLSVESGFNPYAESHAGAQGLMQVMTSVHKEKFERFGGQEAALHPVANIFVGAQILADVVQRGGSMEQGLKLYVGAGNLEHDSGYGARVLGERTRLANATRGKYDFTSPGYGNAPVAANPAGNSNPATRLVPAGQSAAREAATAPAEQPKTSPATTVASAI
jgi:soluble lytic murein transglycosylase-like protein